MAITRTTKKSQETIEVNISDITFIKTTLTNLTLKVDGVEKTCEKLNSTIVGDAQYGQIGMVKKINDHDEFIENLKSKDIVGKVTAHEEYIENDKSFKSKLVGGGIVIGVVWSFVLKFWDRIF